MVRQVSELKKQALLFAKNGFKVFPLTPLSKIPIKGTRGSKEATISPTTINEWWEKHPQANIGIVTERFFVLDIDQHPGGQDGFESLRKLESTYSTLPPTLTVKTGNDGMHLYFLKPQGIELPQKIALLPGVDLKANKNNYLVAPPSRITRQDGSIGLYEFQDKNPVASAPQWLIEFIQSKSNHTPKSKTGGSSARRYRNRTTELLETLVTGAEIGNRNNTIARMTGILLTFGVQVDKAWRLIEFMNGNSPEPLEQEELETTFLSICKKELTGTTNTFSKPRTQNKLKAGNYLVCIDSVELKNESQIMIVLKTFDGESKEHIYLSFDEGLPKYVLEKNGRLLLKLGAIVGIDLADKNEKDIVESLSQAIGKYLQMKLTIKDNKKNPKYPHRNYEFEEVKD